MRKARIVWGSLSVAAWLAIPAFGASYILETKLGADAAHLASRYHFLIDSSWHDSTHTAYAITSAVPLTAAELKALNHEPGVIEVESNSEVRAGDTDPAPKGPVEPLGEQLIPRPPVRFFGAMVRASYVDQPAARIIGAAEARAAYPNGAGVVAIIDTGVDEKHPALRDVLLPGYDFTRNAPGTASEFADLDQSTVAILDQSTVAILDSKNFPIRLSQSTVAILDQSTVAILDQSTVAILDSRLPKAFGHGTMVAGLVHLVAPTARILPLKAFRADGSAKLADIVRAIYYAADHGADVINMSFDFDSPSTELTAAIAYARSKGVLPVASSGNDGKEKKVYPAALPGVFGVASTNYSDRRSPFSNYGDCAKVAAPGEAVITTYPGNNYAAAWGTSFSTPMVAGALAVMHQLTPRLGYGLASDAFDRGVRLAADIGDRLALPPTFLACKNWR